MSGWSDLSGNSGWSDLSGSAGGGTGTVNKYVVEIENDDISGGIATITHSLGEKYVVVQVYDDDDQMIMPDEITHIDTDTLEIDLTSYGTISEPYRVIVVG